MVGHRLSLLHGGGRPKWSQPLWSASTLIGFIDLVLINSLRSEDEELSEEVELLDEKKEPPIELAACALVNSPLLSSNTELFLLASRMESVLFTLLLWWVMERVMGR